MQLSTVGSRLRSARKVAGLSQREVARRFGVDKTTVTRWETDVQRPTLERFTELGEMFDESVSWIAFGIGKRKRKPKAAA